MRKAMSFSMIGLVLATSAATASDFSKPEKLMTALFEAARSGDPSGLADLCDPLGENDGETELICALTATHPFWPVFVEHFRTGTVLGPARIKDDQAEVDFAFGPDGSTRENMHMVRRGDRWGLWSY